MYNLLPIWPFLVPRAFEGPCVLVSVSVCMHVSVWKISMTIHSIYLTFWVVKGVYHAYLASCKKCDVIVSFIYCNIFSIFLFLLIIYAHYICILLISKQLQKLIFQNHHEEKDQESTDQESPVLNGTLHVYNVLQFSSVQDLRR